MDSNKKASIEAQLSHIRGIISYQVSDNEIIVVVKKGTPFIFSNIDGIPVRVIESDTAYTASLLQLEPEQECRTCEREELIGGISIGHKDVTAGTLGLVVYDMDDSPLLLSNNHVLANSNKAKLDDPIIQPGVYDGGSRIVGYLERFKPLKLAYGDSFIHPINTIDAALARPVKGIPVSDSIIGLAQPVGIGKVKSGDIVKKSGRSTGITKGKVLLDNGTSRVEGYEGAMADFSNTIITTPMLDGGDSGSILMNDKNEVVALGFAGSDAISLFTPIQTVMRELGIQIAGVTEEPEKSTSKAGIVGLILLGLGVLL